MPTVDLHAVLSSVIQGGGWWRVRREESATVRELLWLMGSVGETCLTSATSQVWPPSFDLGPCSGESAELQPDQTKCGALALYRTSIEQDAPTRSGRTMTVRSPLSSQLLLTPHVAHRARCLSRAGPPVPRGLIGWWSGFPPKSETTSNRPPPGESATSLVTGWRRRTISHFPSGLLFFLLFTRYTALSTFLAALPFTSFN